MTTFRLRRVKVDEGDEAMLLMAGWRFIGPAKHKATEATESGPCRYWVSPHTGYHYSMRVAVDIEELREASDYSASPPHKDFFFKDMNSFRYHNKDNDNTTDQQLPEGI